MRQKPRTPLLVKDNLHPRNRFRSRYDFAQLNKAFPALSAFVSVNEFGNESIDFSNPEAVKALNKALLSQSYGITNWDIPANYLCPPIPGRADYIHYIADQIGSSNKNKLPKGESIKILDIGAGASCIYPIIGTIEYGWHFVGSDIDPLAIRSAKQIVLLNASLTKHIECRIQPSSSNIFKNIIKPGEEFDATICNPPFHASLSEAQEGTQRKWRNLGIKKNDKTILNFGGQNNELWCNGGEQTFTQKMIEESAQLPMACFWYSTLVSKKTNLPGIYSLLKKVNATEVKTINMAQGQKISRIVAWTFLSATQQNDWRIKRWKN